ncbi:MAG: hypothetical protein E6K13_07215 [Methanobacteriota archaeon]|nr:MAG: hypothetical protein E6K13_07215 [Euryarchaeota archaeon]
MADVAALESLLKEVQALDGIHDAVLVSRSGMYIAGSVPEGVFQDTFVAMFAILLGAAETATAELRDRIDSVVLNLDKSRIVVINDGPKAIFVLRTRKDVDLAGVRIVLEKMSKRIEEFL